MKLKNQIKKKSKTNKNINGSNQSIHDIFSSLLFIILLSFKCSISIKHLLICFDKNVLLNSSLQNSHFTFLLKHSIHVLYMLPFLYLYESVVNILQSLHLFVTTIIAQRSFTIFITK